ncbi:hypothetical protein ANCCAN_13294 [Ancylostoma caninum]|uniref:Uncharacterized protein n=1 Tax=Ancylostoma caninum TaxID=29170 RepID=A0A368G8N4_ANCCA|nr:hypothetical protein ANCCAN_13294 [Ancylostoma caninum]
MIEYQFQEVSKFLESNFAKSIRERLLRCGTRRKLSIEGMLDLRDPIEEIFVTEVHRLDDTLSRTDPNCTALTGKKLSFQCWLVCFALKLPSQNI